MKPPYLKQYDHYFQVYALEFFAITMLPWQWFKAQGIAESGLDPAAVSPVGAVGVMQLMPGTSHDMARKLGANDAPLCPHINIRLGIAYDQQCFGIWKEEHGIERIRFMLGSYNAGPGNILKAQLLAERNHLYPDQWLSIVACLPEITGKHATETINYVKKIEQLYAELTKEKSQ